MPCDTDIAAARRNTPAATTISDGRRPITRLPSAIPTLPTSTPTIRRCRGPPHNAIPIPPTTAPMASASATFATSVTEPNDSTSGESSTSAGARKTFASAKYSSIVRKPRWFHEYRSPPAIAVSSGSRGRQPSMSGNRTSSRPTIANA